MHNYTFLQSINSQPYIQGGANVKARGLNAIYGPVKGLFCIFFLIAAVFLSGCGTSNFSNPADDQATETDTETDAKSNVLEHWETLGETIMGDQSVTYTSTTAKADPIIKTGPFDSIDFDFSLVEDENGVISGDGTLDIAAATSLTGYPMALAFQGFAVTVSGDSITVTGKDYMTAKTLSGSLIRPLFDLTFTIKKVSEHYELDVTLTVEDLKTKAHFAIEVHRTSDTVGSLSFVNNTWSRQGPGILVHYPRKQYSVQRVLSGTASSALLSLNLNNTMTAPAATGHLEIPANLSVNGQAMAFDLTDIPLQGSDALHMVKFLRTGTMDTLNLDGEPVNTAYSLVVAVISKTAPESIPKPGDPTKTILVNQTHYTAHISLILDDLDVRSTLVTEIRRTDTNVSNASFSGGVFVLEGGVDYNISHSLSQGATEDIVKAAIGLVGLDLSLSTGAESVQATGKIDLQKLACPTGFPRLIVEFTGMPADVTDSTIHMAAPVVLQKQYAELLNFSVNANLTVDIERLENNDYSCKVALTADDLETGFRFTTLIIRQDSSLALSGSTWALDDGETHRVHCSEGSEAGEFHDINANNLVVETTLSWRLTDGEVSVKADGFVRIKETLPCLTAPLIIDFNNADITVNKADKSLTVTKQWSDDDDPDNESNVTAYDLSMVLYKTESGDMEYQVLVRLPHTDTELSFTVGAEKSGGQTDIFTTLMGE